MPNVSVQSAVIEYKIEPDVLEIQDRRSGNVTKNLISVDTQKTRNQSVNP